MFHFHLTFKGAARDDAHGAFAMEVRRVREAVRRPVEPAVPRAESGLHQEDQVIRHLCSIALVGI